MQKSYCHKVAFGLELLKPMLYSPLSGAAEVVEEMALKEKILMKLRNKSCEIIGKIILANEGKIILLIKVLLLIY